MLTAIPPTLMSRHVPGVIAVSTRRLASAIPVPISRRPAVGGARSGPQPSPTAGRWLIGTGIALASRRVLTTIPPGTCRDMKVGGVSASLPAQQVTGPWTLVDLPARFARDHQPDRNQPGESG